MRSSVRATRRWFIAAGIGLVFAAFNRTAMAGQTHIVRMLNRGPAGNFVFAPRVVRIAPGDTIRFVAEARGHNSESIDGMVPPGGATWKGRINEDVEVTLETAGVYGYRCQPHYAMGMVGLVVVGDAGANLAEAQAVRHRGRAAAAFAELFAGIA